MGSGGDSSHGYVEGQNSVVREIKMRMEGQKMDKTENQNVNQEEGLQPILPKQKR